MNRRTLLLGVTMTALGTLGAQAQPLPVLSDVVPPHRRPGPLSSLGVPQLNLSFMTPGTLDPRITFARGSTATYFDSTGTMQTAASGAPRWGYNPATLALNGLQLEDGRTNSIRNSTMQGAIPGTPGTMPTNWGVGGSPAVVPQVIGTGTESGIPYIDIRLVGTTTSTGVQIISEQATATAAANGQNWTSSAYVRLVAGTLSNFTNVGLTINETTAAGAGVKVDFGPLFSPTSAALSTQRQTYWVALSGGGTVGAVHPRIQFNVTNGVAIDATFRIGAPQLEQSYYPTSFIPTTSVAVARAADSCLINPANMGFYSPPGGSWFAEFIQTDASAQVSEDVVGWQGSGGVRPFFIHAVQFLSQSDGVGLNTANKFTPNAITKASVVWSPGLAKNCLNGAAIASLTTLVNGYPNLGTTGICFLVNPNAPAQSGVGFMRRVQYWARALSNTEMQAVTT